MAKKKRQGSATESQELTIKFDRILVTKVWSWNKNQNYYVAREQMKATIIVLNRLYTSCLGYMHVQYIL